VKKNGTPTEEIRLMLLPETDPTVIRRRKQLDQHLQNWSEVIGRRVAALTELLKEEEGRTEQQREAMQLVIHLLRLSDIETVRRAARVMNKVPLADLF